MRSFDRFSHVNCIIQKCGSFVSLYVELYGTKCRSNNENWPFKRRMLRCTSSPSSSLLQSIGMSNRCAHAFSPVSIYFLAFSAALRYAIQDTFAAAAFPALLLLKMAHLCPTELNLGVISNQVEQLARLLSEVAAER